jgi:hypothetical protein
MNKVVIVSLKRRKSKRYKTKTANGGYDFKGMK